MPSYPQKGKSPLRLVWQQVFKVYDEMTISRARKFILDTIWRRKTSVSPDHFVWLKNKSLPTRQQAVVGLKSGYWRCCKTEVFVPSWDRTPTSGRLDLPFDRL